MLPASDAKTKADQTRFALKQFGYDDYRDIDITCQDCEANDNCEFAFDPYNTDGDCLAVK